MNLGYIVVGNGGSELSNYPDGPKGGLLLAGHVVTVFTESRYAEAAIERTRKYEREHGLKWSTEFMHVLPVQKYKRPRKVKVPRKRGRHKQIL